MSDSKSTEELRYKIEQLPPADETDLALGDGIAIRLSDMMDLFEQELAKRVEEAGNYIIGDDIRPIFSGHTGHCVYCGELGGSCDDKRCTYDEGLNQHVEGVGLHKMLLCECEKANLVRAEQRKRLASLTNQTNKGEDGSER